MLGAGEAVGSKVFHERPPKVYSSHARREMSIGLQSARNGLGRATAVIARNSVSACYASSLQRASGVKLLADKLIRRSYWLDMTDRSLVTVMVNGIGAHLTNDEKRAHLIDLKRDHLIGQVCVQEILPPKKSF
jgi:hypothetical protein